MHPNKKLVTSKNSPWLLCPSKSFPGKFYYFNGSTGETAWSLNDADNSNHKKPTLVTDRTHAYPEPAGPPADDSNNTSSSSRQNPVYTKEFPNTVRNNGFGNVLNLKRTFNTRQNTSTETNFSHQSFFNQNAGRTPYGNARNNTPSPMFGQAMFPKYVCNETAVPKVIWTLTPMLLPEQPTSKKMLDQITQYEPQEMYTGTPLTDTFCNFNKYPRFNTLPKEVPTFEQMLARRFKSTESLVPKPQTKEEGCQTIPKARLRSLSECNTRTVLKSSKSVDDLTISEESSPKADADFSSNMDKFNTLEDNDLRFLLVAKRRQCMNFDDSSKSEEHTKPKAPLSDLNIKKRVTFALEAQESSSEDIQSNRALSPDSLEIEPEPSSNVSEAGHIWYLAVDTGVLLAEYECIEQFVLSDKNCRLLVPFVVKIKIEALSKGDCIGRQWTVAARHILRRMATPNTHFVVQQEPENISAREDDAILKCCWQIAQENQVVLITDDPKLTKKAKIVDIECCTLVNFKNSIAKAEKQDPFHMQKVQKPENIFQQTIEELRSFGFAQKDPADKLFEQHSGANKIVFGNNENDKLINLTNTNKALKNVCCDVDEIDDVISRLEITKRINKNQTNKVFNIDDDGIINQKRNQSDLNKDIRISGITKLNTAFDLDDELKRFYIKNDVMDVRIKSKRDEWICRLTQIMEGALMAFLLKEKFKFKKFPPPWSLFECIQLLGEKMKNQPKIKNIVDRFNTHLISCSNNGKLSQNMKSVDMIKLVGFSMILIQNLKETIDFVVFDDADDRLSELVKNMEDPRTDVEFNLDSVITPVLRGSDETEFRAPMLYSNKQAEVLEYLKKHFTAMQDYEFQKNENDPKIVRTVGKDLSALKISNNKCVTVDVEKVEPKVIRNVKIIDAYEEKLKKIDEELDYEDTIATFSSENDLLPDEMESIPNGDTMEIIDLSECSVVEASFSSAFYNECVLAYPLMKAFLTEMRRTFMQIYKFIDESMQDYHDRELYEDKRADVNIKTNMALKYIMEIVDRLQSIIERENGSGRTLKDLLVQAGDYVEDDETMAKYKDVVTRYLEQAQVLEEALQALLMLTRDNSDSMSLKD